MHCTHCFSLMIEMERQRDDRTEQTRFECPTCGRNHLVTRQVTMTNLRLDSVESAYDSSRHWEEKYG